MQVSIFSYIKYVSLSCCKIVPTNYQVKVLIHRKHISDNQVCCIKKLFRKPPEQLRINLDVLYRQKLAMYVIYNVFHILPLIKHRQLPVGAGSVFYHFINVANSTSAS